MYKIATILLFAIVVNSINCIDFKDCGSTTGKVTSISVTGCSSSSQECTFKVGTNVTIDTQFQSETDSNTATVKVWGIVGGIPVPFNLQPSDACTKWNIKCPIINGNSYELKITMPVLTTYPRIHVQVRVALLDLKGNKLFCQQFPVHIES